MLQDGLQEGCDAMRYPVHHIGNLAVLHKYFDATLVSIHDGGLHNLHALRQCRLLLGHGIDESLPLQQDLSGHKVTVLRGC